MVHTVGSLAKAIDHALLQPSLTTSAFDAGCNLATRWGVATVCVKSVDVRRAQARIGGETVAVCAVVGFPHANAPIEITCMEAARAMDDGATEIDAVVNLSNVLSDDWASVLRQLESLQNTVRTRGGELKAIFETGLIRSREQKVRLCTICRQLEIAFVKTSTGFAIGTDANGTTMTLGATLEDVVLLAEHAGPICRVKASGGIRTFEQAVHYLNAGATRLGTTSTDEILVEASLRLAGS